MVTDPWYEKSASLGPSWSGSRSGSEKEREKGEKNREEERGRKRGSNKGRKKKTLTRADLGQSESVPELEFSNPAQARGIFYGNYGDENYTNSLTFPIACTPELFIFYLG